jgi:hypothetical protein
MTAAAETSLPVRPAPFRDPAVRAPLLDEVGLADRDLRAETGEVHKVGLA